MAIGLSGEGDEKEIRELAERPSETCIWWYGSVRDLSMWGHTPILDRKAREEGVREEARLEKWVGGGDQLREGERD